MEGGAPATPIAQGAGSPELAPPDAGDLIEYVNQALNIAALAAVALLEFQSKAGHDRACPPKRLRSHLALLKAGKPRGRDAAPRCRPGAPEAAHSGR
jgi:hypothetical protein